MQTKKTSSQFENSVVEICAIRENTRLIARCPSVTQNNCRLSRLSTMSLYDGCRSI